MQEPAETALGHGLICLLKHATLARLRERGRTFPSRIIDARRPSGHSSAELESPPPPTHTLQTCLLLALSSKHRERECP